MTDTARFSGSAIDKLGQRLRTSDDVSQEDFDQLQQLRREFDEALHMARTLIQETIPEHRPTSRLKTVQTLVGKLKREPTMQLSRVQDIAGIRIVGPFGLLEQDELAARLEALFEGAKLADRRAKPSFGYRAVHVIAKVNGRLIEIQIRTTLQDRWAQIVERMADHWGRQIRYGDPPEMPDASVGPLTRLAVVDIARRMSPLIAQCERAPTIQRRRIELSSEPLCDGVSALLRQLSQLPVNAEDSN